MIMRISLVKGDPGYEHYANVRGAGRDARIYLDGNEQKFCLMADEERGEIIRIAKDQRGATENLRTEKLRGRVTIELYTFRKEQAT
jgi:hypothetical protein